MPARATFSGKMDRKIAFQSAVLSINQFGEEEEAWNVVPGKGSVWAYVDSDVTSVEVFEANQWRYMQKRLMEVRYDPAVSTTWRVQYGGFFWDILDVKELGRREGLELTVVTGLREGRNAPTPDPTPFTFKTRATPEDPWLDASFTASGEFWPGTDYRAVDTVAYGQYAAFYERTSYVDIPDRREIEVDLWQVVYAGEDWLVVFVRRSEGRLRMLVGIEPLALIGVDYRVSEDSIWLPAPAGDSYGKVGLGSQYQSIDSVAYSNAQGSYFRLLYVEIPYRADLSTENYRLFYGNEHWDISALTRADRRLYILAGREEKVSLLFQQRTSGINPLTGDSIFTWSDIAGGAVDGSVSAGVDFQQYDSVAYTTANEGYGVLRTLSIPRRVDIAGIDTSTEVYEVRFGNLDWSVLDIEIVDAQIKVLVAREPLVAYMFETRASDDAEWADTRQSPVSVIANVDDFTRNNSQSTPVLAQAKLDWGKLLYLVIPSRDDIATFQLDGTQWRVTIDGVLWTLIYLLRVEGRLHLLLGAEKVVPVVTHTATLQRLEKSKDLPASRAAGTHEWAWVDYASSTDDQTKPVSVEFLDAEDYGPLDIESTYWGMNTTQVLAHAKLRRTNLRMLRVVSGAYSVPFYTRLTYTDPQFGQGTRLVIDAVQDPDNPGQHLILVGGEGRVGTFRFEHKINGTWTALPDPSEGNAFASTQYPIYNQRPLVTSDQVLSSADYAGFLTRHNFFVLLYDIYQRTDIKDDGNYRLSAVSGTSLTPAYEILHMWQSPPRTIFLAAPPPPPPPSLTMTAEVVTETTRRGPFGGVTRTTSWAAFSQDLMGYIDIVGDYPDQSKVTQARANFRTIRVLNIAWVAGIVNFDMRIKGNIRSLASYTDWYVVAHAREGDRALLVIGGGPQTGVLTRPRSSPIDRIDQTKFA